MSRFDRISERVRAVLVWAFGQRKFVRRNPGAERSAGWMHFFIFWGFCILGIQILTMFGRAYSDSFVVPGFSLNLLGGPYLLLRDFMEVAVLIGVGVALVRWGSRTRRDFTAFFRPRVACARNPIGRPIRSCC